MATIEQIRVLRGSSTLLIRFVVAVEHTAATILAEADAVQDHALRLAWAAKCMFDSDKSQRYADVILKVALHLDANLATVGEAVSDAAIVGIVDAYANVLALKGL